MTRIQFLLLFVLAVAAGVSDLRAQAPPQLDDIQRFLRRLELAAEHGDSEAFLQLVAPSADRRRAAEFARTEILPGITRAVVHERDRAPLPGVQRGTGFRVMVDVFEEFAGRGRVASWRLDVQQADGDWHIVDEQRLTAVENLFRLSIDAAKEYDARNLKISVEDLDLTLETGSVFVSAGDFGVTGLVLVGRGEMRFHPRPETEKGQLKIFCGQEILVARFDSAFVRINPFDFSQIISAAQLTARPVDPRELRKAEEIFQEEAPKSYQLSLGDLSSDPWWIVPAPEDFVAEIRTRRYGTLTYSRARAEAEDITLFDRKKHKNIAVYASTEKVERRGLFYNEDDLTDYDVIDYNIDLAVSPDRRWLDGVAHLLMRVRAPAMSSLTLRLAESLVVRSIISDQFGPLFGFRVRNSGAIVINLPTSVTRDTLMTLTFVYSGRLEPQSADRETVGVSNQDLQPETNVEIEPSYLYSNRSYWYPQAGVTDYATATMKISVPPTYDCVASGQLEPGWPQIIGTKDDQSPRKVYWFSAVQPLRYLSFIVSRFMRSDAMTVVVPDVGALSLSVEANPRLTRRGRELIDRAADIAEFYTSLLGDCPFPAFTIALVESDLPGGHSPGYFAALNQPLPNTPFVWRNDPTVFEKYPEFFLAHELAHQWWGQAVGWRNYHEQWLSEGFAQYFAALYAERRRSPEVFSSILRRMRRTALDNADEGPIYLGYRLGHIQNDTRVFRALVYNKGAIVLHMLRRLVGDEAFFRGLRRFYKTSRFRKAGTDDLRIALEAETNRPLERFFSQWVYGSAVPRLRLSYAVHGDTVAVHIEQVGEVFDVPVPLIVEHGDRKRADVIVPLTERSADVHIPIAGPLHNVEVNLDDGVLVQVVR